MNAIGTAMHLHGKLPVRGAIPAIVFVAAVGMAVNMALTAFQKNILREHNCAFTGKVISPKGSMTISTNQYVYACDDRVRVYGFLVDNTGGAR